MKSLKRLITTVVVVFDIILLTGGYSAHSRMYLWIGKPIADLIKGIADSIGGVNAVGWAVIIITAVVRLLILPLFVNQQRNTTINQLKMQVLKPEMEKIQEATRKAVTPEEKQAAATASMGLYRENKVSLTGGISMLTMAIQLPIFSGVYSAIMHAPSLKGASFMGFDLGAKQITFALIAFAIYLLQAWLSSRRMPAGPQQQSTKYMLLLSPVMILFFTMAVNGGVGLYFIVGGIFAVIQTLIMYFQYPRLQARVDDEFEVLKTAEELLEDNKANPAVAGMAGQQTAPRDVTPKSSNTGNRNAGKQNRKP
ncbi:membrane protein insertase YidC [Eupransor demetentiae]|uniref:Membrane protein insertase Oxa1/YidC/SpoIIIJ (YidC) n=1 Tax=Eupransor demetentiae TaxID=3109584 RepID=A0ABP0EQS0_9LACO|nr:Membrane protein insertase Oxa1/YidC/SpoIIIJ (YidC) [Lactobacillaceae bacterium LMG 33000]